jgi:hypothetical protein
LHTPENEAGFSLVELAVTIALLILLSSLATVLVRPRESLAPRSFLVSLRATCHALRQRAMMTNQPYSLRFDVGKKRYNYAGASHPLPDGVRFGVIDGIKGPPANPRSVIKAPVTFVNSTATFNAKGGMSAGTIYVTDSDKKHCYALSCPVGDISMLRLYSWHDDRWNVLP